jgi:hypothetical protein
MMAVKHSSHTDEIMLNCGVIINLTHSKKFSSLFIKLKTELHIRPRDSLNLMKLTQSLKFSMTDYDIK